MPVIWTGAGLHYDNPGMAVPCSLCLAYVGHPCSTKTFPIQRPGHSCHTQREDVAEAIGFQQLTRQSYLQARWMLEQMPVPFEERPAAEPTPAIPTRKAPDHADLFDLSAPVMEE